MILKLALFILSLLRNVCLALLLHLPVADLVFDEGVLKTTSGNLIDKISLVLKSLLLLRQLQRLRILLILL